MRWATLVLLCCLAFPLSAQDGSAGWIAMAARDLGHSQLTLPGGKPFHLKASIVEVEDPTSDFKATIEEYWLAPDKWRRTIENPDFSQNLTVNGDKLFETDKGDYYPSWLDNLVTAIFDPLPIVIPKDIGSPSVPVPPQISSVCTSIPSSNDSLAICFDIRQSVITSVFSKQTGYGAEFHDFKGFEKKQVPREIDSYPAPGFKLQATITQLDTIERLDEQTFAIEKPTPAQDRISSVRVNEQTLRSLALSDTTINWPSVSNGPLKGGCAVYVSADRTGQVREAWPGGCDNAGLEDSLDNTVRKWRLKVATSNGVPVQVEARLTFPFTTSLAANPMPVLSDADARALATNTVDPIFPKNNSSRGTEVTVRVTIDETGKFAGCDNTHNLPPSLFLAADQAIQQWHFRPYVKEGAPEAFYAEITFRTP